MGHEWSNWSGSVRCRPRLLLAPASEQEVVAIVRRAGDEGHVVRVAGSGHSFTALNATDEVLLSLDALQGIESADPAARLAWIRAGSKIHDLGQPLAQLGLALENQGDVDVQTLAGAVSTGTHGTGPTLGNISTQVAGLRFVAASGDVIECSADADRELFRAAQVALGSLGVITAVRMRLLPLYRLHEQVRREPIAECLASLERRIHANRHFEFFWYPADDCALTKTLNPVPVNPAARNATNAAAPRDASAADTSQGGSQGAAEDAPAGATLASAEGERTDLSWKIFPTVRENRFNEMEFSLPSERGVECFLELCELIRGKHTAMLWPVEFRTQAADDILISNASGRATVAISIHQGADLPHEAFFADAQQIFRRHGGRPHWAKLHDLACRDLAQLYPHWQAFQTARTRLDPKGRFLNPYLRRLFVDA